MPGWVLAFVDQGVRHRHVGHPILLNWQVGTAVIRSCYSPVHVPVAAASCHVALLGQMLRSSMGTWLTQHFGWGVDETENDEE